MKVIDLSHFIHEDMTVFPGTEKPRIQTQYSMEQDGFRETKISMFSHVGTHIDAPAHMIAEGKFLEEFHVSQFIGKALVLDFTTKGYEMISLKELEKYKDKIQNVDFVILNTGWSKYWGHNQYFKDYPILDTEAVQWLAEFNLKGVGIDAISVDSMDTEDYNIHDTLLKAGIIIVENLNNLKEVKQETFIFSVLPLKYKGADGSPVRAVAMI